MIGLGSCFGIYFLLRHPESKITSLAPSILLGLGLFAAAQNIGGHDKLQSEKIPWRHSLTEGIKEAQAANKPIIVDGWAEWCAACKEMDVTTYQDSEVKQVVTQDWISIKIDFTQPTDELDEIARKYDMQGLPVTILLPPSGEITKQQRITGYVSRDDLLNALKSFRAH